MYADSGTLNSPTRIASFGHFGHLYWCYLLEIWHGFQSRYALSSHTKIINIRALLRIQNGRKRSWDLGLTALESVPWIEKGMPWFVRTSWLWIFNQILSTNSTFDANHAAKYRLSRILVGRWMSARAARTDARAARTAANASHSIDSNAWLRGVATHTNMTLRVQCVYAHFYRTRCSRRSSREKIEGPGFFETFICYNNLVFCFFGKNYRSGP